MSLIHWFDHKFHHIVRQSIEYGQTITNKCVKIQMFRMACILAATALKDCQAVVLPQEMAVKNSFEGTIAENLVAA